jgi:hypothetical protein
MVFHVLIRALLRTARKVLPLLWEVLLRGKLSTAHCAWCVDTSSAQHRVRALLTCFGALAGSNSAHVSGGHLPVRQHGKYALRYVGRSLWKFHFIRLILFVEVLGRALVDGQALRVPVHCPTIGYIRRVHQ